MKNMHSDNQPTNTVCRICDKRFSTTSSMKAHVAAIHYMVHNFQCDTCEKTFSSKKDLQNHERQFHSVHDQLKCNKCGASFGYSSSFNRHTQSCGKTLRDFKCSICDKQFLSAGALYGHKRTKHSNQSYCCEMCGRHFERKSNYARHVRDVHKINNQKDGKKTVFIKT